MRGGLYGVLNTFPDGESAEKHDPTYVIFLTDGDPNVYYWQQSDVGERYPNGGNNHRYVLDSDVGPADNYADSYNRPGYGGNSATSAARAADEAKAIAAIANLYGIYCGDSGNNPSGQSFDRLVNIITGQGQGGRETISANADTIESKFKEIAQTILNEMGAKNVAVDDGIPTLSSVSSQVVGETSGYHYYIKPAGASEFTDW